MRIGSCFGVLKQKDTQVKEDEFFKIILLAIKKKKRREELAKYTCVKINKYSDITVAHCLIGFEHYITLYTKFNFQ